MRRLLKILSLDILSLMAVECRGGLMGHILAFLSGDFAGFPKVGVILRDRMSPFCFSFT